MIEGYAQVFFLHIPKTAGMSFGRALRDADLDVRVLSFGRVLRRGDPERVRRLGQMLLSPQWDVLQGHLPYPVAGLLERPLLTITFLRHPVDRAISTVEYLERNRDKPTFVQARWRDRARTLEELSRRAEGNRQTSLLGAEFDPVPLLRRYASGELSVDESRKEFSRLMGNPDREMLDRAKSRLANEVQFIGITDAFQESVRLFREAFMPSLPSVERANAAPIADRAKRHARYDPGVLDAIAEANSLDVELYEFAVGLFEQRYQEVVREPVPPRVIGAVRP
jgi:Sulfotransferase family